MRPVTYTQGSLVSAMHVGWEGVDEWVNSASVQPDSLGKHVDDVNVAKDVQEALGNTYSVVPADEDSPPNIRPAISTQLNVHCCRIREQNYHKGTIYYKKSNKQSNIWKSNIYQLHV